MNRNHDILYEPLKADLDWELQSDQSIIEDFPWREEDWYDDGASPSGAGYGPDPQYPESNRLSFSQWQRFLLGAALFAGFLVAFGLWVLTANANFPLSISNSQAGNRTGAATNSFSSQSPADQSKERFTGSSQPEMAPGECSLNQRFPPGILRWCGPITQYASKRNLPPDLVAALILQESGGDPAAFSTSGAVGLMQVMPRDGLAASFMCINGPCFANRPSSKELVDPEFNIAYGTKMLASLLGRHGDLREALRSYGPENVGYYYADKVLGIYQRMEN